MATTEKKLVISKELQDYIIPLNTEEFKQLENNIIKEGCRDPLVVWPKDNGSLVLVDGHNRYKICQKHDIPFNIKKIPFANVDEVKLWMVNNQMGRRNLTPDQLSYYRGLKYIALRKPLGGYTNVKAKGAAEISTSEALGEQFNVSESTVRRDAKFAEGMNIIQRSNPELKTKILSGAVKVKKADVQVLAEAKNADTISIRNEADLHNKAKNIRESLLNDIESKVKKIEQERITRAQKTLQDAEPIFLKKEDRVKKIKGMIISSINKAINKKDTKAIKELKKLIDDLAQVIFD